MKHWIDTPLSLTDRVVDLISMDGKHFSELEILAKDKRIWKYYTYDGSDTTTFRNIFDSALVDMEKGTQLPFVILHKAANRLIGSTRFMDIQFINKKLEIGSTWLHPDYWGTEVNFECKLLLLSFCFETLQSYRVQLKTDENNIRSRKAIEKIGGQFEGILRNDMIRDNLTIRNSAYYSIIDTEWSEKKQKLTELFERSLKLKN